MTIDQAIAYLESQGFAVQKSGKGYLVTDTQANPPKQYPYENAEDLIADALDLSSQGEELDEGQALQEAIAQAQADFLRAVDEGKTQDFDRLAQRLSDLANMYAQWRQSIQPKKEAPSGAFATQAEAQAEVGKLGAGYEAVRDLATGQWFVQTAEEEEPTEQFLGTVSEGGWSIDQYGYTDANGKQVITKRQPRQPIKDPIESLDEMIAKALAAVDFNDPGWRQDTDYITAQSLRAFQKQPTSQERLQMALQIAQSPSDYLTLTALYTGAIARETPAKVGERIAPLAPFLQEIAKQFFLDIPGITAPAPPGPTPEAEALAASKAEQEKDGVIPPEPPETLPRFTTRSEAEMKQTIESMGKEVGIDNPTGILTPEQVARIKGMPFTEAGQENLRVAEAKVGGQAEWGRQRQAAMNLPSFEDEGDGGPKVSLEDIAAYEDIFKKRMAEAKKKRTRSLQGKYNADAWGESIPSFQQGGVVPGIPGFSTLIEAEPGETVMTPEQVKALLQQSGMFGPVYRPGLQELPSFLTAPKTTTISSLTGLRPRSLQTQRRMSPTQRALYRPLVESFGVPFADWQQEEQMATGLGQRRPGARWRLPSMAGLR